MSCRALILQGHIPHYRVPFFEGLGQQDIALTIGHSGDRVGVVSFDQAILPHAEFVGVLLQRGAADLAKAFDMVVVSINPKWVAGLEVLNKVPTARTIVWGHGLGRNRWLNRVRVSMCRRAAAVAVYDEGAVDPLVRAGVPRNKISVVPNTIHVPDAGVDAHVPRTQFLFVGRIQNRKRLDLLIRALAGLHRRGLTQAGLTIVGDGQPRASLERMADRAGVGSAVSFVGRSTDPTRLRLEFARSLAYVCPGRVGLGVLHSFAHGVPIITLGGQRHGPEIANCVEGVNAFIRPDLQSLTNAMTELAENPERSLSMGRAAFDFYSKHRTMNHMVSSMASVISGVAERRFSPSSATAKAA